MGVTPFYEELWAIMYIAFTMKIVTAYIVDTEQFMKESRWVSMWPVCVCASSTRLESDELR